MPCTVVVGAQWGDEGKGKIVDALSAEADVVARYQGGPNAGHSVVFGGDTVVLHMIPSGILRPGKRCLIGNGVVVDLARLRSEIEGIEARGVEVRGRLGISPAAHLILPYHPLAEAASEAGAGAIGTTGRGIGWAYRDKAARTGLRLADLFEADGFRQRAASNLERLRREWPDEAGLLRLTVEELWRQLEAERRWVEPLLTDVSLELSRLLDQGARLLLEGAQGTLLDLDHGTYPFVTSSSACAAGAPLGVGLGPRRVDRVIGVAKAYATRVGMGCFPTEMPADPAARLREAGEEYGATTGRPRRCGWLDLVALRYAARVNGLDELVITKLDVLDDFDAIQTAVAYDRRGDRLDEFPAAGWRIEECVPVYRSHPGWRAPTRAVRRWGDLPAAAERYLADIERDVGVPVTMVSVGAERGAEVERPYAGALKQAR